MLTNKSDLRQHETLISKIEAAICVKCAPSHCTPIVVGLPFQLKILPLAPVLKSVTVFL
jgi:hypothetical protein